MGGRRSGPGLLVPVGLLSLTLAFSLSLLISALHILVLLDGAMPVVHFAVAVAVVRRTAAPPVETLVVHASSFLTAAHFRH